MTDWTTADIPPQSGKTAVITGATGGLGYETALALAGAGAQVVLTGRNDAKGRDALQTIRAQVANARIVYENLDLASLASVADFAKRFASAHTSLDLLINNAAHPGYARTDLIANGPGASGLLWQINKLLRPFVSQSAAEGALPTLFAATSPEAKPAGYYGPDWFYELKGPPVAAKIMPQAKDTARAARLWDISAALTGISFDQLAAAD